MRFDITDDQRLGRDAIRAFLAAEHPLTAVRDSLAVAEAFDAALWKKLAAMGWTSPLIPESYGGASLTDAPIVDLTLIAAEIGRAVVPGPFIETTVAIDALTRSTDIALRDRYLPAFLEGSVVAGWAFDPRTTHTMVARGRAAEVRLDGQIVAVVPTTDSPLLVSTPETTCLLEPNTAGVSFTPLEWLDPSTRHAIVQFDGVTVPDTHVLTTGEAEFERQRGLAWTLQAAELTGIVDAVFGMTLEWLATRYSFGRSLASYQALKHRCADMKTVLEATHAVADGAAETFATGSAEADVLVRAAKAYAASHATELIHDCVQLHGGMGVTWEHDLHLYLRRATLITNTYGTPSQLFDEVAAIEQSVVTA